MKTENKNMERGYYDPIKSWLEGLLEKKFASVYLAVTAKRTFSNTLKAQIDRNRDLIFSFLKEAAPDLTGFVKKDSTSSTEFLVVEVKAQTIKLALTGREEISVPGTAAAARDTNRRGAELAGGSEAVREMEVE